MTNDGIILNRCEFIERWRKIKAIDPATILFVRVGDYYNTYGEDALLVAATLDLAHTKVRLKEDGAEVYLCGVPVHCADLHFDELTSAGHTFTVHEQVIAGRPFTCLTK